MMVWDVPSVFVKGYLARPNTIVRIFFGRGQPSADRNNERILAPSQHPNGSDNEMERERLPMKEDARGVEGKIS
jgi:hypothetical protein